MKFKPGDLVIKNTGGNKMRILECKDDGTVNCVWAIESIHNGIFNENDLVYINEYNQIIIKEKREDIINNIIS